MQVWLVAHGDHDSYGILGVYTDEEKAREAYAEAKAAARAFWVAFAPTLDPDWRGERDRIPLYAGSPDRFVLLQKATTDVSVITIWESDKPVHTLAIYNAEEDKEE